MLYTIAAETLPDVQKHLDRIAVKSAKHGKALSYTVSAEYPRDVRVMVTYPPYDTLKEVDRYTVAAVDINVAADVIMCDGWTVAAYIEHTDAGNIVTAIDGETRAEWRTIPAHCDHCGTDRARLYTYIVRDEDGNYKQVGKSCLHDYTGINSEIAAAIASLQDYILCDDCAPDGYTPGDYRSRYAHVYTAREVLATAVACINRRGYIRAGNINSTRDQIVHALDARDGDAYTHDDMIQADMLAAYLTAYDGVNDILCNARVMVEANICKPSQAGRLAYVPVAVAREVEQARKAAERANIDAVSIHVGMVGERMTISITDCALLTSWSNDYGTTYLYKMHDMAGNVYVWFASSRFDHSAPCTIKATIKAHDERDGVKQTILTRCKIA